MPLYLAIDAGGTKTQCVLADESRILGRGSAGTVKFQRVSEAEATARLTTMLQEVAAAAGVSLSDVSRTCMGLAGLSSSAVRDWAVRTIAGLVGGSLLLCGDEEIALDAAFAGGPGILVIAGTGSNAIGRSADGRLHGAGGWGPVLGDEGAGFWIGLEAIRAALRALDREPVCADSDAAASIVLREIQAHWNLTSLGDLVALANLRAPSATSTPPDFAGLAPVIARCAAGGDALAAQVLQHAGEALATLVGLVAGKMNPAAPGSPRTPNLEPRSLDLDVAFTGSVLARIEPVRASMTARLAVTLPAARVLPEAVEPLDGALWRARHA